mgnify:CR=1 FL=1
MPSTKRKSRADIKKQRNLKETTGTGSPVPTASDQENIKVRKIKTDSKVKTRAEKRSMKTKNAVKSETDPISSVENPVEKPVQKSSTDKLKKKSVKTESEPNGTAKATKKTVQKLSPDQPKKKLIKTEPTGTVELAQKLSDQPKKKSSVSKRSKMAMETKSEPKSKPVSKKEPEPTQVQNTITAVMKMLEPDIQTKAEVIPVTKTKPESKIELAIEKLNSQTQRPPQTITKLKVCSKHFSYIIV